jgi:hypothetical protein
MMFKVRSKLGQAEPVSIVILTGVVLAIALAVYGYFASQAAIASYRQRVQAEISRLRYNTIIDELYSNGTDHFILVKRIDTANAKILFSVVAGEFYGETLLVYSPLELLGSGFKLYLVYETDGGLYSYMDLISQGIPRALSSIYASVDTPLYTGYTQTITLYEVEAKGKPYTTGCGMLLDLRIMNQPSKGYPILLILEQIDNRYYVVDTLQIRRVGL